MRQYVYRPYHSWRHRNRRAWLQSWGVRVLKVLLAVEMFVLALRYIETNTSDYVYERSMPGVMEYSGLEEAFGIGFEPEEGSFFWFHKTSEEVSEYERE